MDSFQHIYSKQRIQDFISKYGTSISIDQTKPILCGIINTDELHIAAQLLRSGELVAFPTETVYGLGANALIADSVLRIFKTKKRPLTDPLIVHVHDKDKIYTHKPGYVDAFARLFWPGPFTLVLKSTQLETTSILSAGTGSIGIRIPNHTTALQLLKLADVPVAAPSANLFTHISPTSPAHVFNDFYDQPIHIIDDGRCANGVESTVVKPLENQLKILRLGSLARETIEQKLASEEELKSFEIIYEKKFLKSEEEDETLLQQELPELKRKNSSMEAPGQLLKHYSANIPSFLLSFQNGGQVFGELDVYPAKTVVIDFGNECRTRLPGDYNYLSLSEAYDAKEAMFNLYDCLRKAEIQGGMELILIYDFETNVPREKIRNEENVPTIQDKVFRSAAGQRVTWFEGQFRLLN